ncbi:MAG: glycosyltransferase family 4 protein [Anaerolineales bacterium]|nr:glycosyltransferase family 4 protein [Anaerolineales bacterium]
MEQAREESLDGMRVLGFTAKNPLSASELYRLADADIYHSLEPSLGSYLAMRAMPDRKHLITFLDPRTLSDWLTELRLPSVNPLQVISNWLYEDSLLVKRGVQRADGLFAAAHFLISKARRKYELRSDPGFLPTPVKIPREIQKSSEPTVCYISRWDRRKRPEIFFELVKSFPGVRFLAAGQSRDAEWDRYLHGKYGGLPNLEILGFIDQFSGNKLWDILSQSWVMVNTAAREGLPNAMKEAAAHSCAILSSVNPEDFASRFGYHACRGDFAEGLGALLENNRWRQLGAHGREYVSNEYALDLAIDRHVDAYESALHGI